MSSQSDLQAIWTPPVIATIVYRVVMIIVSIAFIWKKYRRPARRDDEEQLIGVVLPTTNRAIRRTRPTNHRQRRTPSAHSAHVPTLREVIVASLEDTIQAALGLDDEDGSDGPRISFDAPSVPSRSSVELSSLNTDVGVDIELGDIGLRHRSAESISDEKEDFATFKQHGRGMIAFG